MAEVISIIALQSALATLHPITQVYKYAEVADIAVLDFEEGGTSDFTNLFTGSGNNITANSNSKNNGLYGCDFSFNGVFGICYGMKQFAAQSDIYVRIYLKIPTSFSMVNNYIIPFDLIYSSSLSYIYLSFDVSGNAFISRFYYSVDSGLIFTELSAPLNRDIWYRIEIHYKKAAVPGINNGIAALKLDGNILVNRTDLDNDAVNNIIRLLLGNASSRIPDSGSHLYIDDVVINNITRGWPGIYGNKTAIELQNIKLNLLNLSQSMKYSISLLQAIAKFLPLTIEIIEIIFYLEGFLRKIINEGFDRQSIDSIGFDHKEINEGFTDII